MDLGPQITPQGNPTQSAGVKVQRVLSPFLASWLSKLESDAAFCPVLKFVDALKCINCIKYTKSSVTNSKSYQLVAYLNCLTGASSDTMARLISQRDTIMLLLMWESFLCGVGLWEVQAGSSYQSYSLTQWKQCLVASC